MSIPAWPSSLPQRLMKENYNEQSPSLTISSQPDGGPAKVRRRFTAGVRSVKGQIRLTEEQLRSFIDFRDNDLLGGALRFTWTDPLDATKAVEMRFVDPPSWTASSGFFIVQLSLEILP